MASFCPVHTSLKNLRNLFATYPILDGILNSLKISLITVVGSLLVSSLAAYGFEKFRTRNSEKAYTIFLIGMMIPTTSLRSARLCKIGGFSFAIILPAIGLFSFCSCSGKALSLFRMKFWNRLASMVPASYASSSNRAASMRSTYAAAGIYAFMMSWNNYMWPMIVLQTETKKTITLMVSKIIGLLIWQIMVCRW